MFHLLYNQELGLNEFKLMKSKLYWQSIKQEQQRQQQTLPLKRENGFSVSPAYNKIILWNENL